MKKGRKQKIEQEIDVINLVYCNRCAKEFKNKEWIGKVHEISIDFTNYFSKFDYERWNFDLCEDCILEIVKTFKYVPEGFFQPYTEPSVIKDAQKVFETFKETNEWKPSIGNKRVDTNKKESLIIDKINQYKVVDSKVKDSKVEFVLIEQTNEFCLFLEGLLNAKWEEYLMEHGDGEFVNVAPLAWNYGAASFSDGEGFI